MGWAVLLLSWAGESIFEFKLHERLLGARMVIIPWFLNPAKNPLLKWLFAPASICFGAYLLIAGAEILFFSKDIAVSTCSAHLKELPSHKASRKTFLCAELPGEEFGFAGGIDYPISTFDGKNISFIYSDNQFEKNVRSVVFNGQAIHGVMMDENRLFWLLMIVPSGLFAVFGGLFIMFFKYTRWFEAFDRGWVEK